MATQVSLDLETLGTTVNSQILSIGACTFTADGVIQDKFYRVIEMKDNGEVTATLATIEFWITQPAAAVEAIFNYKDKVSLYQALTQLASWIKGKGKVEIWANGTKFDLGMLEEAYRTLKLTPPWQHNADRCMRTLRKFAGNQQVDFNGTPHHALDDAIWQAKYIALACEELGLEL